MTKRFFSWCWSTRESKPPACITTPTAPEAPKPVVWSAQAGLEAGMTPYACTIIDQMLHSLYSHPEDWRFGPCRAENDRLKFEIWMENRGYGTYVTFDDFKVEGYKSKVARPWVETLLAAADALQISKLEAKLERLASDDAVSGEAVALNDLASLRRWTALTDRQRENATRWLQGNHGRLFRLLGACHEQFQDTDELILTDFQRTIAGNDSNKLPDPSAEQVAEWSQRYPRLETAIADRVSVLRETRDALARLPPLEPSETSPVVAVACTKYGLIFSLPKPARHGDVLKLMYLVGGRELSIGCEQGFLDASGQYLTRSAAAVRAVALGQIEATQWGDHLFSEDLW